LNRQGAENAKSKHRGIAMLSIGRPSDARLRRFIENQSGCPFTYADVGATAATLPDSFSVYRDRSSLGRGEACYQRAKAALDDWRQLRLGWLDAFPCKAPLQAGQVVAVGVRLFGVWSLNACRIVYVVNDAAPIARYGFAYGTLPDHIAIGEERFLVEWNPADDIVRFEINVFSRPRHWLARIGYPALVYVQRRFRREAPEAMRRAVDQLTARS
jgi:uncharacterized protein (UPF0548 family)